MTYRVSWHRPFVPLQELQPCQMTMMLLPSSQSSLHTHSMPLKRLLPSRRNIPDNSYHRHLRHQKNVDRFSLQGRMLLGHEVDGSGWLRYGKVLLQQERWPMILVKHPESKPRRQQSAMQRPFLLLSIVILGQPVGSQGRHTAGVRGSESRKSCKIQFSHAWRCKRRE
jgi:hypothetical protein